MQLSFLLLMMNKIESLFLSIAGFIIEFKFGKFERKDNYFNFLNILKQYSGFIMNPLLFSKRVDYTIEIIEEKNPYFIIKNENKKKYIALYQFKGVNKVRTYHYLSRTQLDFILMDILQKLLKKKFGFLLHGSALLFNNKVFIFLGKEGAGKSTIIKLLKKNFKVLADDSFILRRQKDNNYYFYQTPFVEKESWIEKNKECYQVSKIFFIKKSPRLETKKIVQKDKIFKLIIAQFWFDWMDRGYLLKQTYNLLKFISHFDNFYELRFPKDKQILLNFFNSQS